MAQVSEESSSMVETIIGGMVSTLNSLSPLKDTMAWYSGMYLDRMDLSEISLLPSAYEWKASGISDQHSVPLMPFS